MPGTWHDLALIARADARRLSDRPLGLFAPPVKTLHLDRQCKSVTFTSGVVRTAYSIHRAASHPTSLLQRRPGSNKSRFSGNQRAYVIRLPKCDFRNRFSVFICNCRKCRSITNRSQRRVSASEIGRLESSFFKGFGTNVSALGHCVKDPTF
jgi:hypothetical protein